MIRHAGKIPPKQKQWLRWTVVALLVAMVLVGTSSRPRPLKAVAMMSSAFCVAAILLVLRQDRNT